MKIVMIRIVNRLKAKRKKGEMSIFNKSSPFNSNWKVRSHAPTKQCDVVAKISSRQGRVVWKDSGKVKCFVKLIYLNAYWFILPLQIQYECQSNVDSPLECINIWEKEQFVVRKKKIEIVSEAASNGISLQGAAVKRTFG